MLASGKNTIVGLRSASGRVIEFGDGITVAVGYWGGLTCRAGGVVRELDPEYFERFVGPYFRAIVTWYETIGVGREGGRVVDAVTVALAQAGLTSLLNPGHAISLDEWLTSPMRPGSRDKLRSGMALQCDIIPGPLPTGHVLNCEDTVAVADRKLRSQLAKSHPAVSERIEHRHTFMREELGIDLGADVMPLSSCPAYFPPAWLDDSLVCVVET
jgi:hypothetical protein